MENHLLKTDSGLTAVCVPVPSFHSVELTLYLRMGSRFENVSNNGISHLFEHLIFRGCEEYPNQRAISNAFDKVGCVLNGFTSKDHMGFSVQIPTKEVSEAIKILSSLFKNPLLNELEIEKEIILEELLEDRDENGQNIDIEAISRSLIWGNTHNISLPIIGTEENINKIVKEDLILHHKNSLSGKNIVISASGNLEFKPFFESVTEAFSWVKNGQLSEFQYAPMVKDGPKMSLVCHNSSKVDLFLSFCAFKETDPRFYTLIMLKRILDYGMNSRLYSKICSNLALAYDIEVRVESYIDNGAIDIIASASPSKIERLINEIQKELIQLCNDGIEDEEFFLAKKRYSYDIEFSKDNLGFLTYWYGCNRLYYTPGDIDILKERIQNVNKDDVVQLARDIFKAENCYLALVGNVNNKEMKDFCILS